VSRVYRRKGNGLPLVGLELDDGSRLEFAARYDPRFVQITVYSGPAPYHHLESFDGVRLTQRVSWWERYLLKHVTLKEGIEKGLARLNQHRQEEAARALALRTVTDYLDDTRALQEVEAELDQMLSSLQ
jgi:hypothetical protein